MSLVNRSIQSVVSVAAAVTVLGIQLSAFAAPTRFLVNGATSVTLSNELVSALSSLGVQPGVVGRGRLNHGTVFFPISGGSADLGTIKVEVIHQGGLSFKAGNTIVRLTDFIITNLDGKLVLTGAVTVNNNLVTRAPLFNLALSSTPTVLGTTTRGVLNVRQVRVTLSKEAAAALNQAFNVTAFQEGIPIGTAEIRGGFR